jgi:hypothetical protein
MIQEVLEEFYRRSAICQKYGISELDHMNGVPIPPGWTFDLEQGFYMPPTLLES